MRYLRAARALGRPLVVAIAPDAYIWERKQRKAYWSQADRAETVLALDCVDRVILQQSDTPEMIIRELHPKCFVKGEDWRGQLPDEILAACQSVGAEIRFVETPGKHVSEAHG